MMTRRKFVFAVGMIGLVAGCSEAPKPAVVVAPEPPDPKAPVPKVGAKAADRLRRAGQ